ncbi:MULTISPECIES: TolB family protein [unclassified Paraflavitalea]|uniref:TolB family protein n=1 Tax=unclassified Paraflavitalea TaxID=2798305 RepID=UPI003D34C82E
MRRKSILALFSVLFLAHFFAGAQSYKLPYQIVYTVFQPDSTGSNWDIRLVSMDGQNNRTILQNKDMAFAYASNDSCIFYASDFQHTKGVFQLFEWNKNNLQSRLISPLEIYDGPICQLSPDTLLVATRPTNIQRSVLVAMNIKTGKYREWLVLPGMHVTEPTLSPSKNALAFVGRKAKPSPYSETELYRYDLSTKKIQQLTFHDTSTKAKIKEGFTVGAPKWHPSGEFISYVSQQKDLTKIYRISPDGTAEKQLFITTNSVGWHSWSEDGKWLVYQESDPLGKQFHIYLKKWPDGIPYRLTDSEYRIQLGPVFIKN